MPLATASRSRPEAHRQVMRRLPRPGGAVSGRRVGRPAMAASGVLLVIFCAAAGALVATRSGHRVPYLVVMGNVPESSTLSAGDLTTVDITSGSGLAAIPAADESQVLGRYAAEELVEGTLLSPAELSSVPPLVAGKALVGATLASDQLPAGISAGDSVLVVLTDASGAASTPSLSGASSQPAPGQPSRASSSVDALDGPPGTVLATATVVTVELPATTYGSPSTNSVDVVTLAIDNGVAAEVTAASAANDVSLAIVPPATTSTAANGGKAAASRS